MIQVQAGWDFVLSGLVGWSAKQTQQAVQVSLSGPAVCSGARKELSLGALCGGVLCPFDSQECGSAERELFYLGQGYNLASRIQVYSLFSLEMQCNSIS